MLESNIAENEDMFKRIASLNNQWWRRLRVIVFYAEPKSKIDGPIDK